MRKRHVAVAAAIVALSAAGAAGLSRLHPPPALPVPAPPPGALAVPAPTVAQLCTPGYTKTVRPPVGYTDPLKKRQMAAMGLPGSPADFEEDHLVPLELGGNPTDERNLWPEPWNGPNGAHAKDRIENAYHAAVCAGRIPLANAQAVFMEHRWFEVNPKP